MPKRIILVGIFTLVILVSAGAYFRFFRLASATLDPSSNTLPVVTSTLTYANAYNGPLYLTSEKTGSEAPFAQLVENMDRNGVAVSVAYFGIEADSKLLATQNINTITHTLKAHPGRFTAFYSPGFGSDEVAEIVGSELTEIFENGLKYSQEAVTGNFLRGMGEIEMQVWQQPLTSPEATELLEFATRNDLDIMLHTKPSQAAELETLLQRYPATTFILHQFANDFEQNRSQVLSLMKNYQNLVYTIDADHMLFDSTSNPPIGLLYKFQDTPVESAVNQFKQDFDTKFESLLQAATKRYADLITVAPDRVTIGTELSTDYSFDPEVYDRTLKFIRHFIAAQDLSVQEKLAYQNATRIFGTGTVLR